MPYKNFPPNIPTDKIDSCVDKVMAQGKTKETAIAICYASLVKGKEINYRNLIITGKAITDAPALRGEEDRNCNNCQHYKPLPETHIAEEVGDVAEKITAPSDFNEPSSGRGICAAYEFETDIEWVCDDWAMIEPQLATMKQADGTYRWILFSSSSYLDKDNEIVSQKALEADTARMNAEGNFGTLDWWHTPIVLGDCDFSAMHGRISVESGTFRDNFIGEKFAAMKNLGASRTFYNPTNEPDANGVYHNIRTFSRAILPAERASNRLTLVDISAKETPKMLMDKVNELIQRLGGDATAKAKVDEILKAAETTDKAAQDAGLTAKETDATPAETPAPVAPEEKPKAWFVADMTPDEFDARLQSAVEKFLTPAVKEIGAHVAKLNDAQTATAKEQGDKIVATVKSIQDMQTDLSARLAALEGLTPRAYRATQDPGTAVDAQTVKEKTPKGDKKADDDLTAWLAG